MAENDKEKTAFACHRGLFQFNAMPFGLTHAPAIFQELMSSVLDGLDRFALACLDDILIYSSTFEEHMNHIQTVFDRLREHDLKLKLKNATSCKQKLIILALLSLKKELSLIQRKLKLSEH